ncbi:unnamed protein product [Litomosoides sigmodontis]|uniref:Uncharacterized protein n=1 Tax=Litomosoides sigmodontis TaxID=42156 RepID=A0A3P6UVW4_LITSI|nr:unnamed protein product [Litomosoides sigmodontis]
MADILVEQSPFGCVYRPAEEFMDDDDEGIVYGVLSMLKLDTDQEFQTDIWTLLKARARKYSTDKKILSILDNLSIANSNIRVGLLINERDDLKKSGAQYRFSHIVLILKIRISDIHGNKEQSGENSSNMLSSKKKLTKAQKKRIAASMIANAEGDLQFDYFQYPVQSDVEKDSKFNSVILNGITYRPYRRINFTDNGIPDALVLATFGLAGMELIALVLENIPNNFVNCNSNRKRRIQRVAEHKRRTFTLEDMESHQRQSPIEQFQKLSLAAHTEQNQMLMEKGKSAITAEKLSSGYAASDSFKRQSADDLNIHAIQKTIFGQNKQNTVQSEIATRDPRQLQFNNDGIMKESDITKQSAFKKANIFTNGSSSPSIINSVNSTANEMSEISEELDHDMYSFDGTSITGFPFSSSPGSRNSSGTLMKHNSAKLKSMGLEVGSYASGNSSNGNSSTVNTLLPVKRLKAKQQISGSVVRRNESENTKASEPGSETLSSSTTKTSKGHKSPSYKARKRKRRKKLNYPDESQKHRGNINVQFNELNSGSTQKYESRSGCGKESGSSWDEGSYKVKSKPPIIDMSSSTDTDHYMDEPEKSKKSDLSSNPTLTEFDNCSRRSRVDGKKCNNSVAVQTSHVEPDDDLSPMFSPYLLKNIGGEDLLTGNISNLKGANEREAITIIVQTHLELIKRQARREKRILKEWDSVISDLEERCQLVTFERLKLLLHDSDYSYASSI